MRPSRDVERKPESGIQMVHRPKHEILLYHNQYQKRLVNS